MSEFIDSAIHLLNDMGVYTLAKTGGNLDKSKEKRIKSLGIPPTYKDVWLSKSSKTKIQAVALDKKGKKQYFYSAKWTKERETNKEDRLKEFLEYIPLIKKKTRNNKQQQGWRKTKTMAYMLDIVMETNIRVGNKKYLTANNSYGLTTLRKEHLSWKSGKAILNFRGKHGVQQHIEINNKSIIKFLQQMQNLPEEWLMKYQSQDGKYYRVSAQDLNNYLHSIAGPSFTIKDYRTWGANVAFLECLSVLPLPKGVSETSKNIAKALDMTASKLGNTRETSKKSYVMDYFISEYNRNPQDVVGMGINYL